MNHPASQKILKRLFALQQAAARSVGYHDDELVEAISHHCALKTAAATAPTDELVGQHSRAEERALRRLLRLPVSDVEGFAVKGRYLRAFTTYDPSWLVDTDMPEALLAGMAGAA